MSIYLLIIFCLNNLVPLSSDNCFTVVSPLLKNNLHEIKSNHILVDAFKTPDTRSQSFEYNELYKTMV